MKPYIFVQPEWKDFDRASGESKGWLSPPAAEDGQDYCGFRISSGLEEVAAHEGVQSLFPKLARVLAGLGEAPWGAGSPRCTPSSWESSKTFASRGSSPTSQPAA